jgi:hypothetical protein
MWGYVNALFYDDVRGRHAYIGSTMRRPMQRFMEHRLSWRHDGVRACTSWKIWWCVQNKSDIRFGILKVLRDTTEEVTRTACSKTFLKVKSIEECIWDLDLGGSGLVGDHATIPLSRKRRGFGPFWHFRDFVFGFRCVKKLVITNFSFFSRTLELIRLELQGFSE